MSEIWFAHKQASFVVGHDTAFRAGCGRADCGAGTNCRRRGLGTRCGLAAIRFGTALVGCDLGASSRPAVGVCESAGVGLFASERTDWRAGEIGGVLFFSAAARGKCPGAMETRYRCEIW